MGWHYNPVQPGPRDEVRLAIGDTISADPQLTDEEIAALLARWSNPLLAAIAAAKRLSAHYSRAYTSTVGTTKIQAEHLAGHYAALAVTLRDEALRGGSGAAAPAVTGQAGLVYAGGLSVDDHERDRGNPDLTQPIFTKQPFSQPGTEPSGRTDPASTDHFFNP